MKPIALALLPAVLALGCGVRHRPCFSSGDTICAIIISIMPEWVLLSILGMK